MMLLVSLKCHFRDVQSHLLPHNQYPQYTQEMMTSLVVSALAQATLEIAVVYQLNAAMQQAEHEGHELLSERAHLEQTTVVNYCYLNLLVQ